MARARRTAQGPRRRTAKRWEKRKSKQRARRWAGRTSRFRCRSEAYAAWDAKKAGAEREAKWNQLFQAYSERYPHEAGEFERRNTRELPASYFAARDQAIAAAAEKREAVSTRKASLLALEAIAPALPEIIGGSADLTGSNYTKWSKTGPLRPDHLDGRHINYGVREFGMCAISSGIAASRRIHPVRGYVPDVLRLRAQCVADGSANEAARDLRIHARLHRSR